jgi:hypothetical protein
MCLQTPIEEVAVKLQDMGFERGWGNTVGRTQNTMHLLADIMQACDPETLQASLDNLSKHQIFVYQSSLVKGRHVLSS